MNLSSTPNRRADGRGETERAIRLTGDFFRGRAIEPHTVAWRTPSGAHATRRGDLAETMYRFRYQGEVEFLGTIAGCFTREIEALFSGCAPPDLLVMVPPPPSRPDYARVVGLISELSRLSGIPSAQFAVKSAVSGAIDARLDRRQPERLFSFSSPDAGKIFTGKRVLVIDDIYRSGRSLHGFCALIKNGGGAESVSVLVGTAMEKTTNA